MEYLNFASTVFDYSLYLYLKLQRRLNNSTTTFEAFIPIDDDVELMTITATNSVYYFFHYNSSLRISALHTFIERTGADIEEFLILESCGKKLKMYSECGRFYYLESNLSNSALSDSTSAPASSD